MGVTLRDGLYRATHIPGPSHNYLGLRIGLEPVPVPYPITVRPSINPRYDGPGLKAEEVRPHIDAAVGDLSDGSTRPLFIIYAEIVEDDSRRLDVYHWLTTCILRQAALDLAER